MKFNKIFSLMAAFSLLAVSCQEEIAYTPGEQDLEGCYGVYFPTQEAAGSHTMDPSETPAVEFVVKRLTEDGDITVPVEVTASEDGIFNVPELRFADGQTEAKLLVTFPNAQAGVEYSLNLQITDPEYALIYGANPTFINYSITIERYDLMGKALYREDLLTALFGIPNVEWEVEVYTKETQPGVYYLSNVYHPSVCPLFGEGDGSFDEVYMVIDATNPQKVIFPFQYLGFDIGYGQAGAASLAPEAGVNVSSGVYGTLINGVIEFPVEGLVFGMEGYNDFGLYYSNGSGLFRIALPGAVLTDYTISLEAGFADEGKQPVAFTFGPDVETIKYNVFAGPLSKADIQEKAAEIAADANAMSVSKPAADEEGNVPAALVEFSFEQTGEYTVVAVGCDNSGAAQSSASLVITYVAAGDDVPVVISAGLASAAKYAPLGISSETAIEFYLYGQNLVDVKVGLFTLADLTADQAGCVNALMAGPSVEPEILAEINGSVYIDVMTGLTPGTDYYLLVWASNGYQHKTILSEPWRTDGEPLPIYASYSMENIAGELLPATSEGYFGTYNYYAKNFFGDSPLREYLGQITISDSPYEDAPADESGLVSEYVKLSGLFAFEAEYYGFDDTMDFEYYGGVLYQLPNFFPQTQNGGYYPAVLYLTANEDLYGAQNQYTMIGGFVSEGYIAFVDATGSYGFNGWFLRAFSDEAYSAPVGNMACYQDVLLVDPAVDNNGLAPAGARSSLSSQDLKNLSFSIANEINYVETERGRIHSAIDRANAVKAVGKAAGVNGEWNAPSVDFTAAEAAPVYNTKTTDFTRINDATPALYR